MKDRTVNARSEKDLTGDWEIQFLWRSDKLRSKLFDVAICLLIAILLSVLIVVKRPVLANSLLFIVVIFFFIWVGWRKFPWRPAQIEKSGNELVLTIWFSRLWLSNTCTTVTLSKQKSWSFSGRTNTLKFKGKCEVTFPLNGIAQKDLDFLLDWLGRNFKRVPAKDDD